MKKKNTDKKSTQSIEFDRKMKFVSEKMNSDDLEKKFSHDDHDAFTDLEIRLDEKKLLSMSDIALVNRLYQQITEKKDE